MLRLSHYQFIHQNPLKKYWVFSIYTDALLLQALAVQFQNNHQDGVIFKAKVQRTVLPYFEADVYGVSKLQVYRKSFRKQNLSKVKKKRFRKFLKSFQKLLKDFRKPIITFITFPSLELVIIEYSPKSIWYSCLSTNLHYFHFNIFFSEIKDNFQVS